MLGARAKRLSLISNPNLRTLFAFARTRGCKIIFQPDMLMCERCIRCSFVCPALERHTMSYTARTSAGMHDHCVHAGGMHTRHTVRETDPAEHSAGPIGRAAAVADVTEISMKQSCRRIKTFGSYVAYRFIERRHHHRIAGTQ